jgi:hypothetical protein
LTPLGPKGVQMPHFTFEIARQEEPPILADILLLSDHKAAWCHVEFLACRNKNNSTAFIRAMNSDGEMVIRSGVSTALASIKKCSNLACPLKRRLDG